MQIYVQHCVNGHYKEHLQEILQFLFTSYLAIKWRKITKSGIHWNIMVFISGSGDLRVHRTKGVTPSSCNLPLFRYAENLLSSIISEQNQWQNCILRDQSLISSVWVFNLRKIKWKDQCNQTHSIELGHQIKIRYIKIRFVLFQIWSFLVSHENIF